MLSWVPFQGINVGSGTEPEKIGNFLHLQLKYLIKRPLYQHVTPGSFYLMQHSITPFSLLNI